MSESIKPDVTVQLWVEKPDAAEALMNSASQNASDYGAMGWWVGGGVLAALAMNLLVKFGAGPFGGVIDMVLQTFKKQLPKQEDPE